VFLYVYLLRADYFHDVLRPALTQSWTRRNFSACAPVYAWVRRYGPDLPADCLLELVDTGLTFSRQAWRALFGESLLFGSVDLPRLQTSLPSYCGLLAPETIGRGEAARSSFTPIEQVHLGSRELHFGGYYRPDHAGYNDCDDVRRLLAYLQAQRPAQWSAAALNLPERSSASEREEELADLRDWWPSLVEVYERAARDELVVVCEEM
jgi:hypothetical protein